MINYLINKKFLILFLAIVPILSCTSKKEQTRLENPPNIIVIITDDQGYGDLGFNGNPDIHTPNLDMLAAQSVRFNNFYVCPVCAPTRSSLMTGRYHPRTGVWDTYNGGAIMANEELTIAEVLKDNGYSTGIFGKWHLGDNYPFRPKDQGFTESLVHGSGGMGQVGDVHNYFKFDSSYYNPVLIENGKPTQKVGYCSNIFAQAAIHFIRTHKDQPFFTYLAFNAPHTPLQVPEEYYQMYANLDFDTSKYSIKGFPIPGMDSYHTESAKRVYAMTTNIDDNIGMLLYELDNLDLWKNTIVIFLTDNGPQQIRYNAGLRGRKGSVYEGGIRVPLYIKLPDNEKNNKDIATVSAHIDLFPTILDLCGLSMPGDVKIDGNSLKPLLDGASVSWEDRPLFFHWQRGYPEPYRNIAVRKGEYKLVGQTDWNASIEDLELYNINKDPFEMNNISSLDPDKVLELKADFDGYYEEIVAEKNLEPQRAIIDSKQASSVLLHRNDALGPPGVWAQEQIYAYWEVYVKDTGPYDINFLFHKPLPGEGSLILKAGTIQRTLQINETGLMEIEMKNIQLQPGDQKIQSWYWHGGQVRLPFYLEINKAELN